MIKYASQDIRNKIAQTFNVTQSNGSTILPALKLQNKIKYMNCLQYMQQWSQDMLIRENEIQEKTKELMELKQYIRQANKKKSIFANQNRCHQNRPSLLPSSKGNKKYSYGTKPKNLELQQTQQYTIKIDELVQEQFIKKIEKLFMKHFMLSELDDQNQSSSQENRINSLEYPFQQGNNGNSTNSKNEDNYGLNMDTYAEKESFENYEDRSEEYYDI